MIVEPVLLHINVEDNVEVEVGEDASTQTNNETLNLSLRDVIKIGKTRMEESDIATHRKNAREMRICHHKFLSNAYDKLVNTARNIDTVGFDHIDEQLSQTVVSHFIVNFRNLKMRQNRRTNFISRFQGISNGL